MKPARIIAVGMVIASVGFGAWWGLGRGPGTRFAAQDAQLVMRWHGKYAGAVTMPATLNWCPVTHVAVLEAMSGDSGFVVVLYERDALSAGPRSLMAPEVASTASRPVASAAFRWLRLEPDTAVAGFRSTTGTVRIQYANGKASGDVSAHLRSAAGPDSLVVQGTFRGVPVISTAKGCT
jgi:hypothetical protein